MVFIAANKRNTVWRAGVGVRAVIRVGADDDTSLKFNTWSWDIRSEINGFAIGIDDGRLRLNGNEVF